MNLMGKIFAGIIALMSVVCLTVSALSYASHHNWKAKHDELAKKLADVEQQKKQLNDQKADLNGKITAESETYLSAIQALKTKADALEKSNADLVAENDKLRQDLDARVAVIKTNNAQIADIREELRVASTNLAEAQQVRSAYLQQLAQTLEKTHEYSVKYGDLAEQNQKLQDDYDAALSVLNKNGLSTDPADYSDSPAFAVQGTIENIRAGDSGLMLISIGSDDGLAVNNKLDVRRGDSYLGKIEVVSVEANRAVCKVLPEYRQGVMMEGDDVYAQKVN